MSHGIAESPSAPRPCPSNLSPRGAASRAARTARFPGRDTAAGAYATTEPGASVSWARAFRPASGGRVTLSVLDMRILDRYIVREIFRHAFLGLVVFTFVFFVPQLVRLMSLFVRHSG